MQQNRQTTEKTLPAEYVCDVCNCTADPAEAIFAIAHCCINNCARQDFELSDLIGSSLFEECKETTVSTTVDDIWARIESEPEDEEPQTMCVKIPKDLELMLNGEADKVKFSGIFPSFKTKTLPVPDSQYGLKLLKVKKDTQISEHSHTGDELTLVLTGSFVDGEVRYEPGDVAFAEAGDEEHPHAPYADQECICLIMTKGAPRFTSPIARLIYKILS